MVELCPETLWRRRTAHPYNKIMCSMSPITRQKRNVKQMLRTIPSSKANAVIVSRQNAIRYIFESVSASKLTRFSLKHVSLPDHAWRLHQQKELEHIPCRGFSPRRRCRAHGQCQEEWRLRMESAIAFPLSI